MRSKLIRLAASLPKGDGTRREILAMLSRKGGMDEWSDMYIREFVPKLEQVMTDFQAMLDENVSGNTTEPEKRLRERLTAIDRTIFKFSEKIRNLVKDYTRDEIRAGVASGHDF